MTQPFLEIKSLAKRFPTKDGELTVFEDVSFGVDRSEFVCIIGHSGCGKSTILNVLAGLDAPSDGEVLMAGKEVRGPALERGIVFQNYSLFPWRSALNNVMFGVAARWPGWSKARVREHSLRYLNMVDRQGRHRVPQTLAAIGRHAPARRHRPRLRHRAQAPVAR